MTASGPRGTCFEFPSEEKKASALHGFFLQFLMAHSREESLKFNYVYGEFHMFRCYYNATTITMHNSEADNEKGIFYRDEKEP